ncbi:MAG: T9SS type A sorting domain-containing protein [Bacteroidales bacterium]|nr:T9SS type A sorting domain-containing protein [Bacteroidales bacterium]
MKKTALLLPFLVIFMASHLSAQTADSVDVLNYRICLDVNHKMAQNLTGYTDIDLRLLRSIPSFTLDLKAATVDSVFVNNARGTVNYDNRYLTIPVPNGSGAGDTLHVRVYYHSSGYVENYGMGGFHFARNIIYSLGAVFEESPHTFGRAWFPCRDVFADKATYQYAITVPRGWEATCSGICDSVSAYAADSSRTFHYSVSHPISTYLSSVTIGNFRLHSKNINSLYGTYPLEVRFLYGDSNNIANTFAILDTVVPMFERCFGPYRWGRVGYVGTPRGSMEHVANISLIDQCIGDRSNVCQMVVCHELSHAWFGNLVTCETQADMWFNEGGASFCEEVAMEAAFGKEAADEYYQANLEKVIRTMHHTDSTYHSVANIPDPLTYSGTVYNKGATVWHSLRGYLGDSVFYASMQRLFASNAFGNMTSAQVRDSLSLYSGTDLNKFFDFHVFTPGFTHFSIDSMRTNGTATIVYMRQRTVGTTQLADGNRVPITFFSDTWDSVTKIMAFDGQFGNQTFALPFTPKFAIVDFYNTLSDAVTTGSVIVKTPGSRQFPTAYFTEQNMTVRDSNFLHVSHNWVAPDAMKNPDTAIKRMVNRYWTVSGDIRNRLTGKFFYSRHTTATANYAFLDQNFLEETASVDSLVVLYRENPADDWHYVESTLEGSRTQGYISVYPLKTGEYTLAIADTANIRVGLAAISNNLDGNMRLVPNPTSGKVTVQLPQNISTGTLYVFDASGKMVLKIKEVKNGETIGTSRLPRGTYTVRVKADGQMFSDKLIVK